MANESMTAYAWLKRHKYAVLWAMMILSLAAILVFGGISLAKYTKSMSHANSATVGGFVPVLSCDERLEVEKSISVSVLQQPMQLPFTVTNDGGTTPVLVIVELSAEQVLPLEYALYVNGETVEPDNNEGVPQVYTYTLQSGVAEFSLSVSLARGAYDERFNGVTNDIHMTVICEQAQIGGAG